MRSPLVRAFVPLCLPTLVPLTVVAAPLVVAPEFDAGPQVHFFSQGDFNRPGRSFQPFGEAFNGGVRVATGDVNGDGYPDVIAGAGPGASPLLRVFNGVTLVQIQSFFAFDTSFTGGVFVAAGDINDDGFDDIVLGADSGAGPHVKVFDGANQGAVLHSFLAYDSGYSGGVSVAVGDVNGDGRADIVTGTSTTGSHVRVFDGIGLAEIDSFFAFPSEFTSGVRVAAGDVNGDGCDDVIVSPAGERADVVVVDGCGGGVRHRFDAYPPGFSGGVHVAAGDLNGDGKAEIATAPGSTDGEVKVFDGETGRLIDMFTPFPHPYAGGIQVAIGRPTTGAPELRDERVFAALPLITSDPLVGVLPVVGNFDGNSHPDLATIDPDTGTVVVLPGPIGFDIPTPIFTWTLPGMDTLHRARLDKDSLTDILVSGPVGIVPIRSNFGDFQVGTVTDAPSILTVNDFDGDGLDDVYGYDPELRSLDLFIYATVSNDHPITHTTVIGYDIVGLLSGDIRGTGLNDVIVISPTAQQANFYPNAGDGTFGQPKANNMPPPHAGVVGDFNGDGVLDLATIHQGDDSLRVWEGDGGGLFQNPQVYPTGGFPWALTAAHLDRDGDLDIIVLDCAGDPARIFQGRASNDASPDMLLRIPYLLPFTAFPNGIAVGQLTQGDVDPDIVIGDGATGRSQLFTGETYQQDEFALGLARVILGTPEVVSVEAADQNNDGQVDAADFLTWRSRLGNDMPPPQ